MMRYQLRYVRMRTVPGACPTTIAHRILVSAPHPGDDHYCARGAGTPPS
ncbi:hypothetical protein Ae406Ps2_1633c [Pseudonocardia sp. Ae406_Ps2]|nr:hypothetical protein Ae406Ps2_1633c [Pseudonocardia sp. Ae406_Ps2]OLM06583.1 hypothetical protein Ae331Ps2_4293 [Pseudonocardia sp. Ae331_Ps2]OLM13323.1 hypothetical protein Ae505Ps2_3451 [Pseudonocardia sp. Ae505_Ps2]OLM23204.1 hypothetical protein Ae706Ps2_1637c [Pseudonocardia sp. Ae706_Ps2]